MKLKPEEIQVGDVFEENSHHHWMVVSIDGEYVNITRVKGSPYNARISLSQAARYVYLEHGCLPYSNRS